MVNKLEKCLHPMLAKRDQKWFCHKIQAEMQKQGLGYLILQAPYNVFYATGYTSLVGSSAAVIPAEGDVHLLISTLESADAYASTQDVDVREFMSWVFIDNGTEESRRDKGDVMDPDAIIHLPGSHQKYPHGWQGGHRDGQCHAPFLHRPHRGLAGGDGGGWLHRHQKLPSGQMPVGD